MAIASSWMRKIDLKGVTMSKDHVTHLIFGANTDVGKTLLSAGLCRASCQENAELTCVTYIKPLQCGGSDADSIKRYYVGDLSLKTHTLFTWDTPASPHFASRLEKLPVSDMEVMQGLVSTVSQTITNNKNSITWIETAGGVLSPSSASPDNRSSYHARRNGDDESGTWGWQTQGDLYQPLGKIFPVVLVGDGRLGGISATLSSLESLLIRNYEVAAIVMLETGYHNREALVEYASRKEQPVGHGGNGLFAEPEERILSLPPPPPMPEPLDKWYNSQKVSDTLRRVCRSLQSHWKSRFLADSPS